jgi:hypothetical protein
MEERNPIVIYPRRVLALCKLSLRQAMRAHDYYRIIGAQNAIVEEEKSILRLQDETGEMILSPYRAQARREKTAAINSVMNKINEVLHIINQED